MLVLLLACAGDKGGVTAPTDTAEPSERLGQRDARHV